MMINNEGLRLEAETLSGLMVQLAENEIDGDSFAVMSDLGENGTEHECDLPITETALRASAVIDQLLAALEEKDQQLDAEVREWTQKYVNENARAKSAEQREEHLKATVDVLSAKNAELERTNATQDDHINQQQDRIDTLEKKNGELGKHVGKLEKLLKGTEESLIASVDNVAELQQRLQQPIKLPDVLFIKISGQAVAVMSAIAIKERIRAAGHKVEGE